MEEKIMSLVKLTRNYPSVFDRFFDTDLLNWQGKGLSQPVASTLPSVNVKTLKDSFEIEVAAPGLKKEDFKIELDNDLLTISSEKKIENETKEDECYTCREFSYQSFSRSFTLPQVANTEKVDAQYENGVLTVSIPKKDEAKAKLSRLISIK